MAEAKRKRINGTTPRVIFRFPKLNDPDYGNGKFPKPDGEYSIQAIMKAADPVTKAFIAKLQPLYDEAVANGEAEFKKLKVETRKKLKSAQINPLFGTLYDTETEEPTGEIYFKFAMKASGIAKKEKEKAAEEGRAPKKWFKKPALFDAKGLPIPKDALPDIWGGTLGKVSYSVEEGGYFIPGTGAVGLKLSLEGAQIIELSSGGARTAASHGFGEEDGGFTTRVKATSDVGLAKGFRSGLEDVVAEQIRKHGLEVAYETMKIEFIRPSRKCKYTPDFPLPNGIIIETKGKFDTDDRQKHLLVKAQHPDKDIRFVFSNPNTRISKGSPTTYAMWCEKNGFKYAKKLIPVEWLNEPPS
eukprot:gene22146-23205_t